MNPSTQGPWPGRFVWHDLMSTDAERSLRFYCSLFGWQIESRPMQGCTYHMIHCGPGPIGGVMQEANIPTSHWMPYVAVDDVDAIAMRIKNLGGSVCIGPIDIPDTGRFAVVADPMGAYFSIYPGNPQSSGDDPDTPVPGRVCWNELLSSDSERAQRFYSDVFGWRGEPKDMGPYGIYRVQKLGDKQACGIMKNPQNGAPSAWLMYFLTMNLEGDTELAKQLGAKALMERAPIPGLGAFSMFADPVGAVFALFEPNLEPGANC